MATTSDLRAWLNSVEELGELKRINGADWDLEIGCLADLNNAPQATALLFDQIKGYPKGYRVLSSAMKTDVRTALTLNLPPTLSGKELIAVLRDKLLQWEAQAPKFPPKVVAEGPVLENVLQGKDIDLFKFPVPKWHELDGGRYIGTGDAVITRDPNTGQVNVGTYRIMVHDSKTTAWFMEPGRHGLHNREQWHQRGKACPVAVSVGHHPLLLSVASQPYATEEYNIAGAIRGQPIAVIIEETTGLPIPADSEIVIVGWCPPGKTRLEGPFGEWTGYYASEKAPAPIIEVERIYHRNDPIILGSPPSRPPSDITRHNLLIKSALIHNNLLNNGIVDVRGVWAYEATSNPFLVVSLKQRYPGHAKRAALLVSQGSGGGYLGKYVVVVDEDIDPMNINDVLWAIAFRTDPEKDIDIIRKAWSTPLDPLVRRPTSAFYNSRAIFDACKPYDWIDEFPREVKSSLELVQKVRTKWKL